MKKVTRQSAFAMLSGIGSFVITSAIFIYFAAQNLDKHVEEDLNRVLNHVDLAATEVVKSLNTLNQASLPQCDAGTILLMNRVLFDTQFLADAGFINQQEMLTCTSKAGVLAEQVAAFTPDYVDQLGSQVKFEEQLKLQLFKDRTMKALLVRRGSYDIVVDLERFSPKNLNSQFWQLMYQHQQTYHHLAGKKGLKSTLETTTVFPFELKVGCSERFSNYCVTIYTPWNQFIANNELLFITAIILICLTSLSTALLVNYQMAVRQTTYKRVKKGLKKNAFYWTYQPVIDLNTGSVVGCEVLARFQDKQGVLYPDQFIPVIRKANLTWEFTEKMIATVMQELEPKEQVPNKFKVAFNVFPHDIENGAVAKLADTLSLVHSRFTICFEVTEDEYLDTTSAQRFLAKLSEAGFSLSIDDFGTGYSNLKNLQALSFQQLKIDRTFVKDIETEGLKASMIPNIMALVNKFNYTCVAEGIETNEQEAILKSAGVHFGQGWKYGRPMAINQFIVFITEQLRAVKPIESNQSQSVQRQ